MHIRRIGKLLVLVVAAVMLLTACGSPNTRVGSEVLPPAGGYLTIKDDAGRTVALSKKPERIVVLSPAVLDALYAIGGKAVGRTSSKAEPNSPDIAMLAQVGFVYNVDLERLIALQPDLVIAEQGRHEKLLPVLESAKVPVLLLKMKSYDDVLSKIKLLGDIAGTADKAVGVAANMTERLRNIQSQLPAQGPKAAILHATAKSVTVELEGSVAGSIAKLLNVRNIAAGARPLESDPDSTPYSLEKLVEEDPDIILVVTMGTTTDVEARMRADVESNPAWSSIRAVREHRVVFLPSELFLVNPGVRIIQAAEHLAKIVYPTVVANER